MTRRLLLPGCVVLAVGCGSGRGGQEGSHSAGGSNVTVFGSDDGLGDTRGLGTSETGGSLPDSTAGTTTDPTDTSSTEETSAMPWVDPDCPDVYVGNLFIDARFDVDDLRFTGRVEGSVFVEEFAGPDLEFLGCLHVVDGGFVIRDNANLISLAGLENLGHIGRGLSVSQNPMLETLGGMPPVTALETLGVLGNASLTDVDLPSLERVEALVFGLCGWEFSAALDNPSLQTLDGLANLQSFDRVVIGSQSALGSISRLHEVAGAGGAFLHLTASASFITNNPSLPFDDVESIRDVAAERDRVLYHCNNLGEQETGSCNCEFGE